MPFKGVNPLAEAFEPGIPVTTLKTSLVEDNAELARWARHWQQETAIGIDTEFVRTHTFYPQAGLFQIASSGGEVLVDPLRVTDFEPLRAVLNNPLVTKVIHAGSEDLELFQCFLGVLPQSLFDTQIAAAFVGKGLSVGYQKLVEMELGEQLPASETRSNWLQRPLTESQIHYASADVHFLLPLYRTLREQLVERKMLDAFTETCAELVKDYEQGRDPALYFHKLRGAWRLSRGRQRVLQQLCIWREEEARRRDQPRSHVLPDAVAIEIAQMQPKSLFELSKVPGITHRQLKHLADPILRVVREAQTMGPLGQGEAIPRPLEKQRKELFKRLRDRVKMLAEERQLPDSLLMKKRLLEELTASVVLHQPLDQLPISLQGWREPILTEPLLEEINKFIAEHTDASTVDL